MSEARQYRLIDRESTRVYEKREDDKGKSRMELVDEVEHGLGVVPIVVFYDQRQADEDLVGYPSIQDAVDQSIELFNTMSEKRECAHRTLFNMLAVPEDSFSGDEEKEKVVGPKYVLTYSPDGSPPQWVSAPVEPVSELREDINHMRRRIYELAGLDAGHVEEKREELSGVAYTLRRKPTEEKAIRLGQSFEEAAAAMRRNLAGWSYSDWARRGRDPTNSRRSPRYCHSIEARVLAPAERAGCCLSICRRL